MRYVDGQLPKSFWYQVQKNTRRHTAHPPLPLQHKAWFLQINQK